MADFKQALDWMSENQRVCRSTSRNKYIERLIEKTIGSNSREVLVDQDGEQVYLSSNDICAKDWEPYIRRSMEVREALKELLKRYEETFGSSSGLRRILNEMGVDV